MRGSRDFHQLDERAQKSPRLAGVVGCSKLFQQPAKTLIIASQTCKNRRPDREACFHVVCYHQLLRLVDLVHSFAMTARRHCLYDDWNHSH